MNERQVTTNVSLDRLGSPVPVSYQVQQVEGNVPGQGPKMMVKILFATPQGVNVFFLDGNDAEILASILRKAGRHAKAGIWTPGGVAMGPEEPSGGGQHTDPSSPSTSRSGGQ